VKRKTFGESPTDSAGTRLSFDPAFTVSHYFGEERIFRFNIIGL
jgi:hypothetical protein